jgi:hypothetical protein
MSRLDELPNDQRAALSLLLRQRKSYSEVASLLGIPEHAVHDRAHAALAVLAPRQARELTPERRHEIGEYLLGQQAAVAERLRTRTYLGGSAPAQAWAQALAAELAPLAGAALPAIPAVTIASAEESRDRGAGLSPTPASGESAFAAPSRGSLPSSRLGGALLLAAILAAVIVAVILLSGGSSSPTKTTAASSATKTSSTAKATTTTTGPTVDQRLKLTSPSPKSRSVGEVEILSEGGKLAFYIVAEHIPRSKGFFYAIWLYNSHTSAEPLSKAPAVGSSHRLAGLAALPANAGDYHEILLTRETSTHPTHPGHVVLRGPFNLGS